MTARLSSLLLIAALLAVAASAKDKDKKKSTLPEDILRATTVRVVVAPDAGEPLDQPMANATARENCGEGTHAVGPPTPSDGWTGIRSSHHRPHRKWQGRTAHGKRWTH